MQFTMIIVVDLPLLKLYLSRQKKAYNFDLAVVLLSFAGLV